MINYFFFYVVQEEEGVFVEVVINFRDLDVGSYFIVSFGCQLMCLDIFMFSDLIVFLESVCFLLFLK